MKAITMETRPFTSTKRRHVIWILGLLAFVLSLLAVGPVPLAQAADPNNVNFSLEGCDLTDNDMPPGFNLEANNFVCPDDVYQAGNLGAGWNDLDLVPFRVIARQNGGGGSVPNPQTYTIAIVFDGIDNGTPGYDAIELVTLNASSHSSCVLNVGAQQSKTPGIGGTDTPSTGS